MVFFGRFPQSEENFRLYTPRVQIARFISATNFKDLHTKAQTCERIWCGNGGLGFSWNDKNALPPLQITDETYSKTKG